MAQHDYVIANQSGASFRADLNNALAAIVSNNSGASAPSTTFAFQWWADTTDAQLKLRNAANDGWIVIQELDGTMLMQDGTAGSPGLAFASDLDTGFFSAGANALGIATNGVERVEFGTTEVVFNDGGNDIDFRVEGNTNANLFFVDAGNDRVGIGGNPPTSGAIGVVGSAEGVALALSDNINSSLYVRTASGGAIIGTDAGGVIRFATGGNTASEERVRIDSSGRVGIGTATPGDSLEISAALPGLTWRDTSSSSTTRCYYDDYIYTISVDPGAAIADSALAIRIDNAERLRITSTGQVRLAGAGITFNGDTAAANELDDYEEGTFTPYVTSSGVTTPYVSDAIASYAAQTGRYTKIGRMVHFYFTITIPASTTFTNGATGTDGLAFAGLPFTVQSTTLIYNHGAVPLFSGWGSWPAGYSMHCIPINGNTYMGHYYSGATQTAQSTLNSFVQANAVVHVSGCYEAA